MRQEPRAARGRAAGDPPRPRCKFMARQRRGGSSHPPTCPADRSRGAASCQTTSREARPRESRSLQAAARARAQEG